MHLDELKCHATDLVRLLPRQMLARLAKSTEVDRYAKELQGERLFNLLLYGLIRCKRLSQRKLEGVREPRFLHPVRLLAWGKGFAQFHLGTPLESECGVFPQGIRSVLRQAAQPLHSA